MRKLRTGIIGLGRIASLYEKDKKARRYYPALTHAGAYKKDPSIELVCGADIDPVRLRKFGEMFGVRKLYADYNRMLDENLLDILSVCTQPDRHYEIIKKAAGKVKVIFCEKPFTAGSGEIRKVMGLERKKGSKVTINVYREYDIAHNNVKATIKSGKLGKLQRVNCFYGKGLRNMGSHVLAYLFGALGVPKKIKTLGRKRYRGVKEFTYDVYLEFPKGIPVVLHACDYNNYRLFEMDFICEKGRVQILDEGFTIKAFEARPHKAETGARELVEKNGRKSTIGGALKMAVSHLVRLSRDKGARPIVSTRRYLAVQKVIEEIERQGRRL